MGHAYCYNLVNQVETHDKKYFIFKGVYPWQYFKKYKKLSLKNLAKSHQKLLLSQLSMILKQIHWICSK